VRNELLRPAVIGLGKKPKTAVVKISTSYYQTVRGFTMTKRIEFLRRKSDREYVYSIEQDVSCGGADSVIQRIVNLNKVEDGVYKMIWINEWRDWESGYVEDWDYKLVPYEEAKL
jgi:hypothetical protein